MLTATQGQDFGGDCDPKAIRSNTFTMEWPPGSGKQQEFPEIDQAEWFDLATARREIKAGQEALIDEVEASVMGGQLLPRGFGRCGFVRWRSPSYNHGLTPQG
jgi:predicted NUDIX family NTP pyrophosphohydrolase